LPVSVTEKRRLIPRRQAVWWLHRPENPEQGREARRRMVYEELFLFQLKLQALRAFRRRHADGQAMPVDRESVRAFVRGLPFRLTSAQKRVIAEILRDLESPHAMNRLLQGDVGAGKTLVAATAMFAVAKAGYQAALMVPTEILAEQHWKSLRRLYDGHGIEVGLLVGGMTERQRQDVLAGLQMGMTDIVVGTHALIQDDVYFARLGLVITDEQHRFGDNQRSVLRRKGLNPDVLMMTA